MQDKVQDIPSVEPKKNIKNNNKMKYRQLKISLYYAQSLMFKMGMNENNNCLCLPSFSNHPLRPLRFMLGQLGGSQSTDWETLTLIYLVVLGSMYVNVHMQVYWH